MKLSPKATLAKGALMTYLAPKLAQDAKIELSPLLADVTKANFGTKKLGLIAALKGAVQGKLVHGASIDDVGFLMDAVEKTEGEDDLDPNSAMPENAAEDEETEEEKRDRMERRAEDRKRGMDCATDEDPETEEEKEHRMEARDRRARHAKDAKRRLGRDETEKERDEREKDEKAEDRKAWDRRRAHDKRHGMDEAAVRRITQSAVDTAVSAERQRMNDLRQAEKAVQPYHGDLGDMTFDSAEAIYRHVLKARGVKDVDGIHASALSTVLSLLPTLGAKPAPRDPSLGMDSSSLAEALKHAPGLEHITVGA